MQGCRHDGNEHGQWNEHWVYVTVGRDDCRCYRPSSLYEYLK